MKDSSFDKQFNQGLRNLERRPRPEAWLAIQERLPQRKARPAVWPWYAAAASVAVLAIGAYLYSQPNEVGQANLANNSVKTRPIPVKIKTIETVKSTTQFAQTVSKTKVESVEKNIQNTDNQKIVTELPVKNLAENQKQIAVVLPVLPATNTPIQVEPIVKDVIAQHSVQPKNEVISEKVIVVNVKELEEEAVVQNVALIEKQANKKQFKLGKFLKQLNNARKGDEVNWEEAGINPNGLIAKADEKIEQSKEKVTETYQNVRTKLTLK